MKPEVVAKRFCSNYLEDGICNGIDFKRPSLRMIRFLPEGCRCLLHNGLKCKFFETAVLPNVSGKTEFKEAVDAYYGRKTLKKCQCGELIEPRVICCAKCAEQRRRENIRRALERWRHKRPE